MMSAVLGIYRDRLLNGMYLTTYKLGIDAYTAARFKAKDPNGDGVITRGEAAQLEKTAAKKIN